jgi:hypothetical protein
VANSDVDYHDILYLLAGLTTGDVDGDGFEDLVFGGSHLPTGDPTDPYDDVIFLRRGPLLPAHEVPDPAVSALLRPGDELGTVLATTDLDGDGGDEIGAGNYEALHVIRFDDFATGFSDRGLRSGMVNTRFGDAVCAWPDPMTPGVGHFIGGAPQTTSTPGGFAEGAMWRIDGIPTDWETIHASTVGWVSTTRQGYAGVSIAAVGDRDADGVDDLLVGGANDAWLVSGAQLAPAGGTGVLAMFKLDPLLRGLMDFAIVDAAGDLDGDGLRDLLIGFPGRDHEPCDSATPELDTACDTPQAGHPYGLLWRVTGNPRGVVTLTRADAIVSYSALHSRMGRTADAGDLDGDGDHEVLVPLAQRRGDVVLLFDDDAPTAPERLFEGWAYDVRVADLTGDGRPDLVLYGQEDGTRPFLSGGDIGVFELCPAP